MKKSFWFILVMVGKDSLEKIGYLYKILSNNEMFFLFNELNKVC